MMKRRHFPSYKRSSLSRLRYNADYKSTLKQKGLLKCWVCGWHDKSIEPYYLIELHHIRRVADGGQNTGDNVVALCPSHHSIADHLSKNNKDVTITVDMMISLIREHDFNRICFMEKLSG